MMVIRTYTIQELPTTTLQLWHVRKTRYPYSSPFIGLFCSFSCPVSFSKYRFFIQDYSYCYIHQHKFSPLTESIAACFGYKEGKSLYL